jgi:hypothetical protein
MPTLNTSQIRNDAITSAKIADDQVDSEHINGGALDSEHFSTGCIDTATFIAAGTITSTQVDSTIATTAYVDSVSIGLDFKESVRLAGLSTDGSSGNFTITGHGASATLDGNAVVNGDRVLLKHQTDSSENGIYTITGVGSDVVFTRATDADSDSEVTSGMFFFVEEGGSNAYTGWILNTDEPFTLDTTDISFSQFSGNASQSLTNLSDVTITSAASGEILIHNGSAFVDLSLSGDVTMDGTGAVTIGTNKITNGMMQDDTVGSDELVDFTLASPATTEFLVHDGSDFKNVTMSGDATMANTGAVTIGATKITNGMLADGAVDTEEIAADAIDGTKLADLAVDSEHYVLNSIDETHINWGTDYDTDVVTAKDIPLTTTGQTYTYAGPETDIHEAIALISNNWQPAVAGIQTGSGDDPGQVAGTRYIVTDVGSLHANFGTIGGTPANGDIVINTATGINWTLAVDVSAFGEGIMTWVDSANKIYQWDNSTWSALASSVSDLGDLSDIVGGGTYTAGGIFIADGTDSYDLTALGGNVSMGADGVVAVNSVQTNAVNTAGIQNDAVTEDKVNLSTDFSVMMGNGTGGDTMVWVFNDNLTAQVGQGTTTEFTPTTAMYSGSEQVFLNGALQIGGGTDYTRTSSTLITFGTAPSGADTVVLNYINQP